MFGLWNLLESDNLVPVLVIQYGGLVDLACCYDNFFNQLSLCCYRIVLLIQVHEEKYFDGFAQKSDNSSEFGMELPLSCVKPFFIVCFHVSDLKLLCISPFTLAKFCEKCVHTNITIYLEILHQFSYCMIYCFVKIFETTMFAMTFLR